MPRREPPSDYVHQDRWVVSYADFITLLFAFFVVLYSLSSVNEEKYKALSESLSGAFQYAGAEVAGGGGAIINIGEEPVGAFKLPEPDERRAVPDPQETDELKHILTRLQDRILPTVQGPGIQVTGNELWLSIELSASMLFESGQALPTAVADEILERVAIILRPYDNPVHVEGFTDDQVIDTRRFPSNWELSAARAAAVVRLLSHYGVNPGRLAAVGYGEHQPAYSNRTDEGRQLNRRVVIVVSRDEKVRRTLSAYGSQQISEDAISTVIKTDAKTPGSVIEQIDTEAGGKLFRQITAPDASVQQEDE
ncbi:MAG: flagellar motor protein MotB [Pontibacterium sp.]